MLKLKLTVLALLTPLYADSLDVLLKISTASLVVTTGTDLATAYKYKSYERNPLLRSSEGSVSIKKALALKGTSTASLTYVSRKTKSRRGKLLLVITQLGLSGLYLYGARENYKHRYK